MKKIAYITWGNSSQIRSYRDFSRYLDQMIYLREIESYDLSQYDAVVLPDSSDGASLRRIADQLNAYVAQGGFLIAFCAQGIDDWIEGIDLKWQPINTKDWLWWTKPRPYLEIHQPEPKHPMCENISLTDMSWHWKGVYEHRANARSILNLDDDSHSLFLDFDKLPNGGRILVTTLDPHCHNGERFMPATTRFLEAFYPWLNRELVIERDSSDFTMTYLQSMDSPQEWQPDGLAESFEGTGGRVNFHPLYELNDAVFATSDIIYLPQNTDEIFLETQQKKFLSFLERGGHLILCSQPAVCWLPFLSPFQAVPPRPFSNIKVRVRDDRFGFFSNMDRDFDGWQGIFGQYARGWTEMPDGAIWLTDVGSAEDPKPADWLWQYPTSSGMGGYVFMHAGDNLVRYPDHGPHQQGLVRDICLGLMKLGRDSGPKRAGALPSKLTVEPERQASF
ncbi:hypothetical protein ACFSM5_10755 [Lacibacterium aquatile]|uniref:ThuA-like domain-containing protein n=1 Tax=Lacibacterium aquatile TaxID=1168082 RepID=A0ABW5DQB7_9PROT